MSIRVLVVEDSSVASELISHILNSDPGIHVMGVVNNGAEAIKSIKRNKPDIVTMDINMPGIDGFDATRTIMETDPVPIIIVTGRTDMSELEMSFRAIEAGALAVLQKPHGIGHPDYAANAKELITTVKLMSEIRVVRRWARTTSQEGTATGEVVDSISILPADIRVVAMGASTGGPPVIQKILSTLPKHFLAPLLIVQHMSPGFIQGFVEWLGQTSALPVHIAFNGSIIRPGHVYFAPDGVQMKVDANGRISCIGDAPENGLRPSISYLFRSVAKVFGKNAAGVLLTGMGKDGALELKLMREKGAVTFAQDQESSAVFGIPGEAVKLEAANYVLPPEKIAEVLARLLGREV
jgi:two-component system chemotaxis response regulator CheB